MYHNSLNLCQVDVRHVYTAQEGELVLRRGSREAPPTSHIRLTRDTNEAATGTREEPATPRGTRSDPNGSFSRVSELDRRVPPPFGFDIVSWLLPVCAAHPHEVRPHTWATEGQVSDVGLITR